MLVYPNSGEGWDAAARCWTGTTDPAEFGAMAAEWFAAGAQMVGGCCRTRPAHIRAVARAAEPNRLSGANALDDQRQRGVPLRGGIKRSARQAMDKLFAAQQLVNLAAGVVGPGTAVVQP